MRLVIAAFLLLLISSYPVHAEGEKGLWGSGMGFITCDAWRKIEGTETGQMGLVSWAFGFVTAINVDLYNSETPQKNIEFFTKDYILGRASKYCSENKGQEVLWPAIIYAINDLPNVE